MWNKMKSTFLFFLMLICCSFSLSIEEQQQEDLYGQRVQELLLGSPQEALQAPIPSPQRIITQSEEDGHECRCGFSVRKALRSTLRATQQDKIQVKFQDILTNAGRWDSTNNVFIAPCPGLYFFTFNAMSEEGQGFTLALMKNDKYQVTAYGGKEGYQWGANSAMLFLNPDDIVYLQLQDGEIYEHPFNEAYTTFTGFLVNKI